MQQISIAGVIVENRFRRDMGEIEKLKTSMAEIGLLQPIGIDKDRRLVFGGRRLEAAKLLGWQTIAAKVVDCDALIAEHDENEMRKAFTVTERVAIAEAVAERLRGRVGNPEFRANSGNISGIEKGETKDLAAAKAGLGSGKTLEAAQAVIASGVPELVQAMDDGKVSIHAAKNIAAMPPEDQAAVDYADPRQVKNASDKARNRAVRAKAPKQAAKKEKPCAANAPPVPDEARLYEPDSSLSALVLSHRAKTAISQISKNDPNALTCIEGIRAALDRQLSLITMKDA